MRFQYLAELVQLQVWRRTEVDGAPSYSLGSFKVFLQSLWLLYLHLGQFNCENREHHFILITKSV